MDPHNLENGKKQSFEKQGSTITKRQKETKEILFQNFYYDVTNFMKHHPGGRVIEFYTNTKEDATHAIQQFHYRSKIKVNIIMKSLPKRPALTFEGFTSHTEKRRKTLSDDFSKLYNELEEEGLFETSYIHNGLRFVEVVAFLGLGYYLVHSGNIFLYLFGILLATLAHGRSSWLEHEAGHRSLTGIPNVDQFLQSIFFGVGVGLSARVWNTRHKRHHSMPNKLNYDIDLELMPALLSDIKLLKEPEKQFLGFVKYQVFFMPLTAMGFITANQFYHHPKYILKHRFYLDGICMILHYVLLGQLGLFPFLVINYLSLFYNQLILALNHTSLPVHSTTYHWVEFTFYHTLNITQNWYTDWWMGYVNTQIEHHLFPSMPHFRHKLITDRVRALAKKHSLPYHEYSFWGALFRTLKYHYEVQKELQEMF